MSLVINHNMMALAASRNLAQHYDGLSTSVRRLSSGLRVGTSADDAAGLAIRELMRADIAAMNQGVRNANDAISMLQTADGALGVIDEKLIRLAELAEQAATGTYNSDQRLMIDSEFQAMKSEITRIALATDFNDIKLLCNDTANKLYVGVGQEVTYGTPSVEVGYGSAIIDNPDAITADAQIRYGRRGWNVTSQTGDANINKWWLTYFDVGLNSTFRDVKNMSFSYSASTGQWSLSQSTIDAFNSAGFSNVAVNQSSSSNTKLVVTVNGSHFTFAEGALDPLSGDMSITLSAKPSAPATANFEFYYGAGAYPNIAYTGMKPGASSYSGFDLDGDGVTDIWSPSNSGMFNLNSGITYAPTSDYVTKIHFGTSNESAEDYYYIQSRDCTTEGLGIGDTDVRTQANAQRALTEIDDAIILKDQARAYFGSMQNRLENTISNLQIQAENIQAAESRISDVDVSTEMTEFMRVQILSNAAVAMLSQANSLPQMALSLIS